MNSFMAGFIDDDFFPVVVLTSELFCKGKQNLLRVSFFIFFRVFLHLLLFWLDSVKLLFVWLVICMIVFES